MSLQVRCHKCKKELDDPGALLFGPPDKNGSALKFHLCTHCYVDVVNFMAGKIMSERVEELEKALNVLLEAQFHADRSLDLARGQARELTHKRADDGN